LSGVALNPPMDVFTFFFNPALEWRLLRDARRGGYGRVRISPQVR
jgi:hypothetical protein